MYNLQRYQTNEEFKVNDNQKTFIKKDEMWIKIII